MDGATCVSTEKVGPARADTNLGQAFPDRDDLIR